MHNLRSEWVRLTAPHLKVPRQLNGLLTKAHHRGQVWMLAHQLGFPLPNEAPYGIWNWERLWKECGAHGRCDGGDVEPQQYLRCGRELGGARRFVDAGGWTSKKLIQASRPAFERSPPKGRFSGCTSLDGDDFSR
jgi:hypothetical protein